MTVDQQLAYLTKGCVDVVRRDDLRAKLDGSHRSGAPLVVKVGFDPTAPDLHLGHTVLLRKMKHFQDLGHTVIFLIGDFTGLIGDPTGRSKTRPPLTPEQIAANAETYKQQVFKLLDPVTTRVDFNSRWLASMTSYDWVQLAARYNVAQMLERRDFRQRYEAGQPIALHEFLYSLTQAYDSVFLRADVEMGGTDQLFNLNVGRDIMPSFGLPPQVLLTVPLLVGLDGVEKMSKSLNNYVGVNEPAAVMFGKLMSISDELMWTYYQLLTDLSTDAVDGLREQVRSGALHPRAAKVDLARRIVTDFHAAEAAAAAEVEFDRIFVRKELPSDLPEYPVEAGTTVEKAVLACELASSGSEASRKLTEGAIKVDGARWDTPRKPLPHGDSVVVQVGRRAARAVVWGPNDVLVREDAGVQEGPSASAWSVRRFEDVQLDSSHLSRESAVERALELTGSAGRVYVWSGRRVVRAGSSDQSA